MDDKLSEYGLAKVRATLKLLQRIWDEEREKSLLKPQTSPEVSVPIKIEIQEKKIVGWLKQEGLTHKDLSNIFERLKSEGVLLTHAHAEFDEDEERSPYFKKGYFEIKLPFNYQEQVEAYEERLAAPQKQMEAQRAKALSKRYQKEYGPDFGWLINALLLPIVLPFLFAKYLLTQLLKVLGEIIGMAFKSLKILLAGLIVIAIAVYFIQPSIPTAIFEHVLNSPILKFVP